mmetsp:Transcript_20975/g.45483  ORF Transcript_20975/g.45483 Transcript_20975/m.45483 type:complete len:304 (+) Transcript_20975:170-1081(+)
MRASVTILAALGSFTSIRSTSRNITWSVSDHFQRWSSTTGVSESIAIMSLFALGSLSMATILFASSIETSPTLSQALLSFKVSSGAPNSLFSSSSRCFSLSFSALVYLVASSMAVSHRLAVGSHVLPSSEHPFQRIRNSTRPRRIRRPTTASTSQKKSSGAAASSSTFPCAAAMMLPAWSSSSRPFLRAFLLASSVSAFLASLVCLIRRCSRTLLMEPGLDRERFLSSFLRLPLRSAASEDEEDLPFFAFLFLLAAVESRLVAVLRLMRSSASTSTFHSRSEQTLEDGVDMVLSLIMAAACSK